MSIFNKPLSQTRVSNEKSEYYFVQVVKTKNNKIDFIVSLDRDELENNVKRTNPYLKGVKYQVPKKIQVYKLRNYMVSKKELALEEEDGIKLI